MKNLILTILLTISFSIGAHPLIDDPITNALKTGNSSVIASYFNTSVDLTIPNNEGVYSKVQAELILKTFFSKNKPSDFKVVHNGDSKNDSHYSIGNMETSNGSFRTYILYKENGEKITIIELRIESDE